MKSNLTLWSLVLSIGVGTACLAQTTPRSTTATQAGRYRRSSTGSGTPINNSNTANYNSNNVVNAPTGVGSSPTVPAIPSSGRKETRSGTGLGSATGAAVQKARTAPSPAVSAGSTERNTSIRDFIASSPNYITLQNALQSVDLFETLNASKPYTLFAPTNDAFKQLPPTVQKGLLEGRNREALKHLINYHLVRGSLSVADLRKKLASGNVATLKTVAGEPLTIEPGADGQLTVTDQTGKKATISEPDRKLNNGYVHGVNAVLMTTGDANGIR